MRKLSGVGGPSVQEFEGKIRNFVGADKHRNAAALLSHWLQQVKPAYVQNGQNEDTFYSLQRSFDYKQPKTGFLKEKKTAPSGILSDQIKSAQAFTKALENQRFDSLTIDESVIDLRHLPSTEKIPMHIWAHMMRLYAYRGAYGKACRLFEFVHKFHVCEASLPCSSDKYGQSILDDEIFVSGNEHINYRLCAYYALSAAATAHHKPSLDSILHLLSERKVALDDVMKALLLHTESSVISDVHGFIQHIYEDLGNRGSNEHENACRYEEDYARARVILRHVVRYMCSHQQYDEAYQWVKTFCQRAHSISLALPFESLEDAIQTFASRDRVDLAVELSSLCGTGMGMRLYDATARAYTNAGNLKQLQDLVQSHKVDVKV
ncbi:hypothetical protein EON63_06075 [archaeon]|nr:MAG: hypothetical protein EON63_06075 [archaeon]